MVTATATTPTTKTLDQLRAELRAAEKIGESAAAALAAARQRFAALLHALQPESERQNLERLEWLRARRDVKTGQQEIDTLEIAWLEADRQTSAAREALRARVDAAAAAEAGAVTRELIPILLQARKVVDQIAALKARCPRLDLYTWPELQSPDQSGAFSPTLDCVIRSAKQYGWL